MRPVPLSVLDLAPISLGSTAGDALRNSLDLARHAERLGYRRHWVAEHHNMPGIASAATAVVVGHLAAGTSTIRVGAGGIMLPNHSPLVIAEQFGTLEALFPGRIDLGLGRAPGTDQLTARALRRDTMSGNEFPQDVQDLQFLFGPPQPGQAIRAVPGAGLEVPLWILGSSTFGARLAASLGLPYAFASHFAPTDLLAALDVYRREFRPSRQLQEPYTMAGLNVFAAATDEEARRLFTTPQQSWANRFRGLSGPYPPPIDDIEAFWSPAEKAQASAMLTHSVVGSSATVAAGVERFVELADIDEVMVVSAIFDHEARLHSYEILAAALTTDPSTMPSSEPSRPRAPS
ncbi:LLM class flavin-dependent oxidoreductase [Gaiella sp.]|uniref:LLM class flavin-dependent oxidoreductase n=1 Tax=Gaiella sp. TaxID=2663207 RepID=UPI0032643EF6